ncbi:ABC transporter permease [Flavobacterium sp. DGU11]|uniref:ABC transporter permease n=1 Tax=Flavobacterium arundinis TaxID=3139143 RepID=A0ABU9HRM3_9FLAO
MNLSNLIKIAFKAIQLNKMRAFLTMLGIIIGVASVIAMLAIGEGSKQSIKAQISAMGSNMITIRPGASMMGGVRQDASTTQSLTMEDLAIIEKESKYTENTSPLVNSGGQSINGSKNWPTTIYGVNPDYIKVRGVAVKEGAMFSERDVKTSAKVAIIGTTVVENLFAEGEDPIGKTIRFNSIPFKVVGVLSEKGENTFGQDQDDVILAPYTAVQKRILAVTYLQSIVTSAKSEEMAELAVTEITALLRGSHNIVPGQEDDFNVFSQQELISAFSSTSEMLTVLLVAIAGISLLIGGIGIMNIMYVSVKERTREIGLRMAVGGSGSDILLQFLTEAVIISVVGGILGVLLGLGATFGISLIGWPVSVTLYSLLLSFAVCALTGIFFGWYPAKNAAALDPITALRYE